jgi:transcriptional regulator
MYLPAHFAETRRDVLHALIARCPLGLLMTQDRNGSLQADPVPFVLDADADTAATTPGTLRAHVARANPLWRESHTDAEVLVVFQGPEAYVSPSYYPSKAAHGKVVPTWNYIVVEARGRLRAIEDRDWLHAFVTRLTDRHESPRAAPWGVADAPAEYVETMLGAIVGIEVELTTLVGKWKVSQNRSAADRAGVAQGLHDAGVADAVLLAQPPGDTSA